MSTTFKSSFTFAFAACLLLFGSVAYGASFSLSPSGEIDFNAHAGATATQNVTITNETAYPLALTLSYSGSGSGVFSTSTNYLTLNANDSQMVTVTFTPTMAGLDSAKLNVTSTAGDSASDLLVGHATGIGSFQIVQGSGAIQFNTHAGTPTSSSIDIKNLTNSVLPVTLTLSGSPTFTASTPAVTLGANGSQDVTLTFTPLLAGDDTANLMLMAGNGDTQSVMLIGHAVTPSNGRLSTANEVDFTAQIGQSECLPVTISNTTLGAVAISNLKITGDTNAFTTNSNSSMTINGGSSGMVTVCFYPTTLKKDYDAMLQFSYVSTIDSSLKGTVSVNLDGRATDTTGIGAPPPFFLVTGSLDFDNIIVGTTDCQALQITNPTKQAVTIDSATLSGSEAGEYEVSGASNLMIGANSTEFVTVCITPAKAGGDQDATLDLHYTVNGTTNGTINVKLNANAIDTTSPELTNCIYVRHATGVIGPIVLGGMDTSSLYLTNRTNAPVTISGASITGSDAAAFTINPSQFPVAIQSGQQGQLLVSFNPTGLNGAPSYRADLNLTLSGSAMTCGPVSIHVEGVAVPGAGGKGDHDTSSIDLGSGLTGNGTNVIAITNPSPKTQACIIDTVTFMNTTNAAITVTNITVMQNQNITLLNPLSSATTVSPGGTLTAYVQFCGMGEMGVQFNTMLFVATNQSIQPQVYQIQAIDPPAPLSVNELTDAQAIDFSILPNPSAGEVTLDIPGAAKVKAEVYNLLGGLVTTINGTSNLAWNGRNASGSPVSSGAYIIRVSGTDVNGQPFVTSKEMVIQR